MLKQLISLKKFFTWRAMLSNVKSMKRVRSPIRGYITTTCIWALMECSLLDEMTEGDGGSLDDFASQHQLNPDILMYICRYLDRLGYMELKGDAVRLTHAGGKLWKTAQGVLHLFHAYEPLFTTLTRQLRNEASFGSELHRREDEVAKGFSKLAGGFIFPIMAGLVRRCNASHIIDLGCAEVELGSYLCQRDREMHCLGIDNNPAVVEGAKAKIQRLGFQSHIDVILGDIFDIDRVEHDFSPYELVTAVDLFHGFLWEGEDTLIALFKKLKATFNNQRFLISEMCLPPHAAMKKIAYPYVEHELFHDLTHQRTFSPGQLEQLFERAGFVIGHRWSFRDVAGRIFILLD